MKAMITAAALASLAVPAVAAPAPQSSTVHTGDLNLASERGQKVLALRIHRAASAMCAGAALGSLPQTVRSERACIREAQSRALAAAKSLRRADQPLKGSASMARGPRTD